MQIKYDEKKLNSVLKDFCLMANLNVNFLDADMKVLFRNDKKTPNLYCRAIKSTPDGRKGCACSDAVLLETCRKSRKVEIHECHAGLIDAAVPVIFNGSIAGYIILGAMRHTDSFSEVGNFIGNYPIHRDKMAKYYETLPLYDKNTITSIANIAAIIAKYVIHESMIRPSETFRFGIITDYIDENITDINSYRDIVDRLYISKSTLFREFHNNFDCTPQEYIMQRKTEHAKKLLACGNDSVENISQILGFSSASYFGRIFKKYAGVTPLVYRKRRAE